LPLQVATYLKTITLVIKAVRQIQG